MQFIFLALIGRPAGGSLGSVAAAPVPQAPPLPPGSVCRTITFEGVAHGQPIPAFDGITLPDWVDIVDRDAGTGAEGNQAFEPSPSTVATWIDPSLPNFAPGTRQIQLRDPVTEVRLSYASFAPIGIVALDVNSATVATALGPVNFEGGPRDAEGNPVGDPTGS